MVAKALMNTSAALTDSASLSSELPERVLRPWCEHRLRQQLDCIDDALKENILEFLRKNKMEMVAHGFLQHLFVPDSLSDTMLDQYFFREIVEIFLDTGTLRRTFASVLNIDRTFVSILDHGHTFLNKEKRRIVQFSFKKVVCKITFPFRASRPDVFCYFPVSDEPLVSPQFSQREEFYTWFEVEFRAPLIRLIKSWVTEYSKDTEIMARLETT